MNYTQYQNFSKPLVVQFRNSGFLKITFISKTHLQSLVCSEKQYTSPRVTSLNDSPLPTTTAFMFPPVYSFWGGLGQYGSPPGSETSTDTDYSKFYMDTHRDRLSFRFPSPCLSSPFLSFSLSSLTTVTLNLVSNPKYTLFLLFLSILVLILCTFYS